MFISKRQKRSKEHKKSKETKRNQGKRHHLQCPDQRLREGQAARVGPGGVPGNAAARSGASVAMRVVKHWRIRCIISGFGLAVVLSAIAPNIAKTDMEEGMRMCANGLKVPSAHILPTVNRCFGSLTVPWPNQYRKVLDKAYPDGWAGKAIYKDPVTGRRRPVPADVPITVPTLKRIRMRHAARTLPLCRSSCPATFE